MNRANVTLAEVLGAASSRAAAMVPESAGYLVLSLCDALGNLPIRVEDAAVTLSLEGVVAVDRQGEVLSGAEAARGLRELLARLLATTGGGGQGLHAVARARAAAERGPSVVAAEIEAALVPLNRGAAKRTLARLAKETARAVEAGLRVEPVQRRAAVMAAPVVAAAPVIAPAPAPVIAPAPIAASVKCVSVHSLSPDLLFTAPPSGPLRDATPTLEDPMSIEATPLCAVDLSILEATPEPESSSPAAAVFPASAPTIVPAPLPVRATPTESTLLSAREAAVMPVPAPVSVTDPGTRVLHESTLPWPVGLGMVPRTPRPHSARAIVVPVPSMREGAGRVEETAPLGDDGHVEMTPSAEELLSFEFEVYTPLPSPAVAKEAVALSPSGFSAMVTDIGNSSAAPPVSWVPPVSEEPRVAQEALVAPPVPQGPDRVDELLKRFAQPEGGEEAFFRATASSLKELAGLAPTPYAPAVGLSIHIPARHEGKSPEWLPEARQASAEMAPAPLVKASRRAGSRAFVPLALLVVVLAGAGVLAWTRPGLFAWMPRVWKAVPSEGAGERPVVAAEEGE